MKTKVFFDARMTDHPGIGRYIKCFCREIFKINDGDYEFYVMGKRGALSKLFPEHKEQIIDYDYPEYSLREQYAFLKIKDLIKTGVLHVPHYNIPFLYKGRYVCTIHDIIHLLYPQGASSRFAPFCMSSMVKKILRSSRKIICVSGSTRDSIKDRFGKLYEKNKYKFKVIHEAPSDEFRVIQDDNFLDEIRKKYKLPEKFIVYVGSVRRHKNVKILLESFKLLRLKEKDARLVIVGKNTQKLKFRIYDKNIMHIKSIADDTELAALYNLSTFVCSVSLFEGFGFPLVEAQKCGKPVVCSDIPVFREILKDSALFVNPGDKYQIADSFRHMLTNAELMNDLNKKSLLNSERFSWARNVEKTLQVYKESL